MRKIIDNITIYLAEKIIPIEYNTDENIEIVSYGICSIITSVLNIVLSGLTSFFLGTLSYYFCFIVAFIPIRLVHKGFHCKTFLNCLLLTNVLFNISTILCTNYSNYNNLFFIFFIAIVVHYLISNERRIRFHFAYGLIYVGILFFSKKFQIYFIIAILLNILLMIGGKYNDEFSKEKII